jgi:hypothetical protein
MSDEPYRKRWRIMRLAWTGPALFALYVLSIGPVCRFGCGSDESMRTANDFYAPLRPLARLSALAAPRDSEGILAAYILLWEENIVFDYEWGLLDRGEWVMRECHKYWRRLHRH